MATRTTSEVPWHKKAAWSLGRKVLSHEGGHLVMPEKGGKFGVTFGKFGQRNARVADNAGIEKDITKVHVERSGRVHLFFNGEKLSVSDFKKMARLVTKAHAALKRYAPP